MTSLHPRSFLRALLTLLVAGAAAGAQVAAADPPARVGRLSYVSGIVSFSPAGDDQWAQAVRNRPLIAGDRLWSDRDGRVEVEFGSGAVRAGATTSVGVVNMDNATAQFELTQGALDLRVRRLARNEIVEIDTPNLALQVTQPGRYRIEVDPQSDATVVLVREGTADVFGERVSYVVDRGQGYRFYGTDLANPEYLRPHGIDALDRFAQERDARFARAVSARYVSPYVVGYEDLDRYGTWRQAGSYGNVWFPQDVPADWAPYRDGHWSWIDPWGWTWVDDAPWGFAPFHYGRWAYVESRWGWVPGPVNVQPVYAPALVAFVGGATLAVAASSGPAIGWFPLAPREVYRPAYAVSRDYYRAVNVSNTVVTTTIINNTYVNNFASAPPPRDVSYANLRVANAVTAVPPSALAESRPVRRSAVRVPARSIDVAQVTAAAQVAPSRTAFVGAAPSARARPPERAREQAVVARTAPPPPAMPVAQKLPLLERTRGRPLERADIPTDRAGAVATPPRNVKVVDTQRPAARQAPPAASTQAPAQPDAARPAGEPKGGPARERDRRDAQAPVPAPGAPPGRERGRPNAAPERARPESAPAPERGRPNDAAGARPPSAPASAPAPQARPEAPPSAGRGAAQPSPGRAAEPESRPPAAPAGRTAAPPREPAAPPPQAGPGAPRNGPPPAADDRRRPGNDVAPGGAKRPEPKGPPPVSQAPHAEPPPAPRAASPAPPPASAREAPRERPQADRGPPQRPAPAPPPTPAAKAPSPAPEHPPAAAPPRASPPPRAPEVPKPAPPPSRAPEAARPAPPAPPPADRGAQQQHAPAPPGQARDERRPDNRGKGQDDKKD